VCDSAAQHTLVHSWVYAHHSHCILQGLTSFVNKIDVSAAQHTLVYSWHGLMANITAFGLASQLLELLLNLLFMSAAQHTLVYSWHGLMANTTVNVCASQLLELCSLVAAQIVVHVSCPTHHGVQLAWAYACWPCCFIHLPLTAANTPLKPRTPCSRRVVSCCASCCRNLRSLLTAYTTLGAQLLVLSSVATTVLKSISC
jgi:hypothetical protein